MPVIYVILGIFPVSAQIPQDVLLEEPFPVTCTISNSSEAATGPLRLTVAPQARCCFQLLSSERKPRSDRNGPAGEPGRAGLGEEVGKICVKSH